jgi:hypothetical protein
LDGFTSYSISVNGYSVRQALEFFLDISDPCFEEIRDILITDNHKRILAVVPAQKGAF